jgi:hypothetical protein
MQACCTNENCVNTENLVNFSRKSVTSDYIFENVYCPECAIQEKKEIVDLWGSEANITITPYESIHLP